MSKGKMIQLIFAVLLVGLLAAGAVVIGVNWSAITAGARGENLYTKGDVTDAYDKGFNDGALKKFEEQSAEIGRLQAMYNTLLDEKNEADAAHAAALAALQAQLDELRANIKADLDRAFAQGVASVDLENRIKDAYDKGYADGANGREPEIPPESKVWNGKAITNWYGKTGADSSWSAAEGAYLINTPEQFAGLAELVNGGNTLEGERFILHDDMILNAVGAENPKAWTPIGRDGMGGGTKDYPGIGKWSPYHFAGEFDGNGHTVSGVHVKLASETVLSYGIFGSCLGARIHDLTVTDTDAPIVANAVASEIRDCSVAITGGRYAHGGIVGDWYNARGAISVDVSAKYGIFDCTVTGSIAPDAVNAGGLIGTLYRNYDLIGTRYPTLTGNTVAAEITAPDYAGGMIGYVERDYMHADNTIDLPSDLLPENVFTGTIHCTGTHYSSEIGGFYLPEVKS